MRLLVMHTRAKALTHTWWDRTGAQPSSAPTASARATSLSWRDAQVVKWAPLARAPSKSTSGTSASVTKAQVRNGQAPVRCKSTRRAAVGRVIHAFGSAQRARKRRAALRRRYLA